MLKIRRDYKKKKTAKIITNNYNITLTNIAMQKSSNF